MRDRPQSDTRERIITAADRLFREIGYQKTTVADIARTLGMSPANVYRFFSSKKAINEAVTARCTAEIRMRLEAVAASGRPAAERMRALLLTAHQSVLELGVTDAKMQEMIAVAMAESWGVIRAHIEEVDAIITRVLRDGVASGEFVPSDPEVTGPCIRAAMMRFCHPGLLTQCHDIPRPTVEQQADFILSALGHHARS
ncbi:TetR/AcrR family transcriptional regulator [Chelatococcus sp. SYSU_G07232]|uniref:TetR/AcrR family transcriptional regulator n=1 Tax=Chelatococcus albus TaxID=3047466 RepID=A0ABT7AJN4_9HYPH|nr:TetR/AcrR family transcriptional regulator [Chelatococcus sp. SYSU_G07232]MDJ1158801.1 TetR/AcrR family transcriptional regulator [Chelatococcus sp. SYSU_G07232]